MSHSVLIGGKYELLRKIASGGMAEVYLAKQTGLVGFEKLVVIKRILPHLAANEEFVRMFLDEARTAADLRHTNVVQIYEVGEDQGTYFIAMEFLHGQDLRRVLRKQLEQRGRVPLQHGLQMIIDAAAGLHYAHQKSDLSGHALGIVHRDISPQNIITTYDGTSKIVDFGIAKAASQSVETRSGVLKGKYSYMSPEQASGEVLDQRTDQFALGIVAYELTTATRLFKYPNEIMTLHAIIECRVTPPAHVLRGFPVDLSDIIMRSLSKNREDRYPNLGAFVEDIEDFMARESMVHSPQRVANYMQELFKEDIAEESNLGHPMIAEELSGTSNIARATARGSIRRQQRGGSQVQETVQERSMTPSHSSGAELERTMQTAASDLNTAATQPTATQMPSDAASNKSKLPLIAAAAIAILLAIVLAVVLKPAASTGRIIINTNPQKAKVYVDGHEQPGLTPTVVENLHPGQDYVVKLELFGYDPVQERIRPNGKQPFNLQKTLLKSATRFAVVGFSSDPPGAKVYINGEKQAKLTPFELGQLKVGTRLKLIFIAEGYQDSSQDLIVKEGLNKVHVELAKKGAPKAVQATLKISGQPATALLFVDGDARGKIPQSLSLSAGEHQVELRADGYISKSQKIKLTAGKTRPLHIRLQKKPVQNKVDASPEVAPHKPDRTPHKRGRGSLAVIVKGGWAIVYVDGKKYGETPIKAFKLSAGRHKVRLVNPDLKKRITKTITIIAGQKFKLRHKW